MLPLAELFDRLDELLENEESKFEDLGTVSLIALTDKGAVLKIEGRTTSFPLSQLRQLDGSVYAAKWILRKKEEEGD